MCLPDAGMFVFVSGAECFAGGRVIARNGTALKLREFRLLCRDLLKVT